MNWTHSLVVGVKDLELLLNLLSEVHEGAEGVAHRVQHTTEDDFLGFLQRGSLVRQFVHVNIQVHDVGHVGSLEGIGLFKLQVLNLPIYQWFYMQLLGQVYNNDDH